jgi:hypothetical protein
MSPFIPNKKRDAQRVITLTLQQKEWLPPYRISFPALKYGAIFHIMNPSIIGADSAGHPC